MAGDGLDGLHANCLFNVAQTVEPELIDCIEGIGVLPVVLDDVNVVGGGQKTGEGGCFRVPQWRRYDACGMIGLEGVV